MSLAFMSRSIILILIIIAASVISIFAVSYQYSTASAQIRKLASDTARLTAQLTAHDLSNSLSNRLQDIANNVQIISKVPAIQENNFESARKVIDASYFATTSLVDFYMWLDKDGRIVWISDMDEETYSEYAGFDLSYRSYFIEPRETYDIHYSSVIDSNDKVDRLYVSYPILGEQSSLLQDPRDPPVFEGVIVAAVRAEVLGQFLHSQLSPAFEGKVGLIDNRGIIIYDQDPLQAGGNVFGVQFQSSFDSANADARKAFNDSFKDLLQGNTGSRDFSAKEELATIAYSPVSLDGKYFSGLYVVQYHSLTTEVVGLIQLQWDYALVISSTILATATILIFVIMSWNKKLERTVVEKTTQLVKANEMLLQNDRLQKEFINIAAHELRTPIAPILMSIGLQEKTHRTQFVEMPSERFEIIARNARRLKRLSDNILDVSRIESATLSLDISEVDLNDVLVVAKRDLESQITDDLKIEYRRVSMIVQADKDRLIEVVSNLLANAARHTGSGTIKIIVTTYEKEVVVSFKDSGTGIDPDILPRLFTKFATKSEKGTGLGLFISKSIIEAHGGRIWAENNRDSDGATFSFSLPTARLEIERSR